MLLGLAGPPDIFNFIFFIFRFFYLIFLYGKENKLMRLFLYYIKFWVKIIFFSFEVGFNFLIKTYLFLSFKNVLKEI
jgi:hypothetical protein